MLRSKLFQARWFAIAYLIFISLLFLMPGTAFPRQNFLTDIHFDKWIHIGLFAVLLFLWKSVLGEKLKNALLVLLAGLYGFIVEVGQREFVANRGFDEYDIVADVAGSILGLIVWWWVYKKNKPL